MHKLLLISAVIFPSIANAAFTSASLAGASTLSFNEYPKQEITTGPAILSADSGAPISFSATNQFGSAGFSSDAYGLGSNGVWTNDEYSFAWVNGSEDGGYSSTMTFTFLSGPVSAAGGLMNYVPGSSDSYNDANAVSINALDAQGNVLESYRLEEIGPIRTTDQANAAEFRGIIRSSADIYAFQIQGGAVVREINFIGTPAPIPEPQSSLLMALGFFALFTHFAKNRLKPTRS